MAKIKKSKASKRPTRSTASVHFLVEQSMWKLELEDQRRKSENSMCTVLRKAFYRQYLLEYFFSFWKFFPCSQVSACCTSYDDWKLILIIAWPFLSTQFRLLNSLLKFIFSKNHKWSISHNLRSFIEQCV